MNQSKEDYLRISKRPTVMMAAAVCRRKGRRSETSSFSFLSRKKTLARKAAITLMLTTVFCCWPTF